MSYEKLEKTLIDNIKIKSTLMMKISTVLILHVHLLMRELVGEKYASCFFR